MLIRFGLDSYEDDGYLVSYLCWFNQAETKALLLWWLLGLLQIEGNNAKADDAIMLDKDGYVSETNATNIVSLRLCYSFCLPLCT